MLPDLGGGSHRLKQFFGPRNVAKILFSDVLGIKVLASEPSPEHRRRVSGWFRLLAVDFVELSFSVENVISMMNFRRQRVREKELSYTSRKAIFAKST